MSSLNRRAILRSMVAFGFTAVSPFSAKSARRSAVETPIVIGKRIDDIASIDPHESVSASGAEIIGNLYETLINWDPNTRKFLPGLATKWMSNGGVWTFTLDPKKKFSSGNLVTSTDVAFSFQRLLDFEKAPALVLAPLGVTASNFKKACLTDSCNPYEFIFKPPSEVSDDILKHCLTSAACSILDSEVVKTKCAADPIWAAAASQYGATGSGLCDHGEGWLRFNSAGSGPFEVVNAVRTDEIVLQRRRCHDPAVRYRPIVIRDISDAREQRRMLETDDIQIARNLPDASWAGPSRRRRCRKRCEEPSTNAASAPKHPIDMLPPGGTKKANLLVLCMNVHDDATNPLRDADVRRAIRLAIDVQSLAEKLNSPRWSAQPGFCPSILKTNSYTASFDLDEARRSLGDRKLKLTLRHAQDGARARLVQLLAGQLAKIGVTIEPRAVDGRQLFADLSLRNHQLALLSWNADYYHPQSHVQAFCVNSEIENRNISSESRTMAWYCRWYDAEMTSAAHQTARLTDPAELQQHYDAIQKGLFERGPYAFLMEETDFAFARRNAPALAIGAIDSATRYPTVVAPPPPDFCLPPEAKLPPSR